MFLADFFEQMPAEVRKDFLEKGLPAGVVGYGLKNLDQKIITKKISPAFKLERCLPAKYLFLNDYGTVSLSLAHCMIV